MAKVQRYPQLLDKIGANLRTDGEYNKFYQKYVFRKLSGSVKQRYDDYVQQLKLLNKRVVLPFFLLLIFGLIALFSFCILINVVAEIGFAKTYSKVAFLFYLTGGFILLTLIDLIVLLIKKKNVNILTAEYTSTTGVQIEKMLKNELSLPDDFVQITYFQRLYKAGSERVRLTCIQSIPSFNDDNYVYFHDGDTVLRVPKRDCLTVELIEEKISFTDLYGSVDLKSPEVKQHKIRTNGNTGQKILNNYGRLLFQSDGEMWTIDVPPFAFEDIKKLFGRN